MEESHRTVEVPVLGVLLWQWRGPGNGLRDGIGKDLMNDRFLSLMWKRKDL